MIEEIAKGKALAFGAGAVQNAHVFLFVLKVRVRSAAGRIVPWANEKFTAAIRPLPIITGLVVDLFRSREELMTENMMRRQQLHLALRNAK